VLVSKPVSAPGTEYLYSNAGFAIAGHMAEVLTKKAWEDLTREELFEPLGMTSAGFGAPGRAGGLDEPCGHGMRDGAPVDPGPNADNPPAIAPAGTVHATLSDWAKYAAAHLRGAKGRTDYLKAETFARLQAKPAVGHYAFGWDNLERPWANGHALHHNGSNTMWYCVIWLAPRRDCAFMSVCNAGGDAAARATDAAIGALMAAVEKSLPPVRK
jgi:CubicO group peptidase (beta-lactamase class C family)